MGRERRLTALACASAVAVASCGEGPPRISLETTVLRVGGREVRAEIARTPAEMSRGLMYRRSLGRDCGMLFVYEAPRILSFWMKNTRIPLDIAFIDDGGRILQIEGMRPYDESSRAVSREPARFALEMNRGWFARNGVGVGGVAEIPVEARAKGGG